MRKRTVVQPKTGVLAKPPASDEALSPPSYLSAPPGSLTTFFSALLRVEQGQPGAIVRVLHYGDSPTSQDFITADVRALLDRRFGDGGHGFVLIAKPWAWYSHRGSRSGCAGLEDRGRKFECDAVRKMVYTDWVA